MSCIKNNSERSKLIINDRILGIFFHALLIGINGLREKHVFSSGIKKDMTLNDSIDESLQVKSYNLSNVNPIKFSDDF